MFIDYTKVEIHSGKGGSGAVSFRREKYVSKGGPDGGDGGRGGNVVFTVNQNLHTLQDIRYKHSYKAGNGQPGGSSRKFGKNGADVYIPVPPGTVIKNAETGKLLADLTEEGQFFVACYGGKGGKGNVHYKSATNQTPQYAQSGLPGEQGVFELELKVLADVGLVGLPNAGKSTLLARVSAARPKIADYPFTTLQPHLGIVKYEDYRSFVMADIPGLIEGASRGKGLGHQFLRHIERTNLLLYMIEALEENPKVIYETLKRELVDYHKDLALKPSIVIRTKFDIIEHIDEKKEAWKDFPETYLDISSVSGYGLTNLIKTIVELINEN